MVEHNKWSEVYENLGVIVFEYTEKKSELLSHWNMSILDTDFA